MSVNKTKPTKDGRCWIFQKKYVNLLGEKKSYSSAHYKTKKEAKEAESLFEVSFTDNVNYNGMTFLDLYNKYVEIQKTTVKQTTIHSYYKRWDYVKIFEKVRLCDFSESHYQLFRKDLMSKNLSDSYRNDIQKFLKILLNFATKWYGLDFRNVYNKFKNFNDPNAPIKEEMLFFTFDEYCRFREGEDDLLFQCAFDILYYCGLRRGELLGLNWTNVDFFKKEIRIKDNLVRDFENGGFLITSPKTKKSIRTIPITDNLVDELKLLKERAKKVYGFKEKWFVLGYEEPMKISRLRDRKNLLCDKAGLKQIRLHDFRHSCASLLISRGANITLVGRYLGHTKIDETLNTYSHFFKSDLDSIVRGLNNLQK